MIWVGLLDDGDEALTARDIDTFTTGVIVQIIGVVHTWDAGDNRAAIGVQHYKLRWLSGHHVRLARPW